jgi:hypothetical protein
MVDGFSDEAEQDDIPENRYKNVATSSRERLSTLNKHNLEVKSVFDTNTLTKSVNLSQKPFNMSQISVILVGASGVLGAPLLDELVKQRNGFKRIAILATPDRAAKFDDSGVEVVVGSLTESKSYEGQFHLTSTFQFHLGPPQRLTMCRVHTRHLRSRQRPDGPPTCHDRCRHRGWSQTLLRLRMELRHRTA